MIKAKDFQNFTEGLGSSDPFLHALWHNQEEVYQILIHAKLKPSISTIVELLGKGENWKKSLDLTFSNWNIRNLATNYAHSLYSFARDLPTFQRLLNIELPFSNEGSDRVIITFLSATKVNLPLFKKAVEVGFKAPKIQESAWMGTGVSRFRNQNPQVKKEVLDWLLKYNVSEYISMHYFTTANSLKELDQLLKWAEEKSSNNPNQHYCLPQSHHYGYSKASMMVLEEFLFALEEDYPAWPPTAWEKDLDQVLKRFQEHGYHLTDKVSVSLQKKYDDWFKKASETQPCLSIQDWVDANLPNLKAILQRRQLEKNLALSAKDSRLSKPRI